MAEQLLESYAFEPEYTPEELEALTVSTMMVADIRGSKNEEGN